MNSVLKGFIIVIAICLGLSTIFTAFSYDDTPAQVVVECPGYFHGEYKNADGTYIPVAGCGNTTFNLTDGVQYFDVQMDQGLPDDYISIDIYKNNELVKHEISNEPYGEVYAFV